MNHRSQQRRARPDRRGTSLVVTAVLVSSLAAVSLSLASLSRSSAAENRAAREESNAYYIAQAGLAQAVQDLRAGGTGAVGSQQDQQDFGGSRFWVEATDIGGDMRSLVATGLDDSAGARVELVLQIMNLPFFRFGAFGELGLTLDSNATVDSYNSNNGPYGSTVAQKGNAGSNGNIRLRQNSRIHGNATPGPGQSVTILGNAVVTGATTPAPTLLEMPAIEFPVQPGFLNQGAGILPPGTHAFNKLVVGSSSTLIINGPADIVCNLMELRSNAKVVVNATLGPVNFYVKGDFVLNSNAQVYSSTYKPADIHMYLNGDNIIEPDVEVQVDPDSEFEFNSNSKIYGVVYAPNASVEINSNFELFGSLMAKKLHLDSNSKIHFDEALLTSEEDSESVLQAVLWRRRPFSMSELGN